MRTLKTLCLWLALGSVLAGAGLARFHGLDWDQGQHLHPDERFLAIVADKIRLPGSVGGYFDTARSPLNPYNQGFDGFAYGTGPLFLTRAVAEMVGMANYDRVHLVGRVLSASFDVATVFLVFLLGRVVYGGAVGLVAAALLAGTVLHIQLSHFFAVDTFLTFFTTLGLLAAYLAWLRGSVASFILLGIAVGLAAATKLSGALLLPIVGLVAIVPPPDGRRRGPLAERLTPLALCSLVALLAYRVAEPYSFAGDSPLSFRPNLQRFADLDRWVKISSGEIEVPFMIQWARTPNPWFALQNLVSWGLGPPLGIASLLGLAVGALSITRWPRGGRHLLLVVWLAMNLGYFSFQFAKFMRYFLPAYPALVLMGAWLLVDLARRGDRLRPALRWLARAAAPAVLLATWLYAAMFSSIYGAPNTRVQASAWIYQHVPPGSTIAVEHWDDALPLRLPGFSREYSEVSMELYDEESPAKAVKLVDNLARADVLVLSSNRLYGSIPRLPERYPIAVEYYRLLFGGELGFDLAARFDSPPRLGPLRLDDGAAQEDFTVYDHPTVLIFRKSERFDRHRIGERLSAVSLADLERVKPVEAGTRRGLMLPPTEWRRVVASGTWRDRFSFDGLSARVPVVVWLLAVEVMALAALPICWWVCSSLPDRGFAASKMLGLALASYLAWLAASLRLAPFGPALALAALFTLGGIGCIIAARLARQLCADVPRRLRTWLVVECVFLSSFALMLAIRSLNPDLWHSVFGGEKPMDFAYFNAVLKTPVFPPYDPWFAGGYINYYYFGFVLAAVPTLLSGVLPAQAYNLAVATLFSLTATLAFAFGTAIIRGPRPSLRSGAGAATLAGVFSALLLCVLGNLDAAVQLRDALWRIGGEGVPSVLPGVTGLSRTIVGAANALRGAPLQPFDFWRSTRFIGPEDPGPIHEFPFFTFLYGDLHAHMFALPLQLLLALVGLELARTNLGAWQLTPAAPRRWLRQIRRAPGAGRLVALLALAALLVGMLRATNTWDFPTYLALSCGALLVALRPGRSTGWATALLGTAIGAAGLYGLSTVFFLPYLAHYELFYSGVVPVRAATDVGQFLTIHGLLLLSIVAWLGIQIAGVGRTAGARAGSHALPAGQLYGLLAPPMDLPRDARLVALGGLAASVEAILFAAGRGVLGLTLALAGAACYVAARSPRSPDRVYLVGLLALAAGVASVPEVVAVRGDVGRMNTVFKFYLQAWVLLAIVGGPAAVLALRRLRRGGRWSTSWGRVWAVALAFLIACAALYPLRATPIKVAIRFEPLPPTLDGMAFMAVTSYAENGRDLRLPDDYAGIRWMLAHVDGTPTILEGNAPLYHWGSRFSVYTGLPTVLGWDWHQKQQRWGYQARVEQRQRDVKTAYETADVATLRALLAKYDVRYIVVGGLERAYYPASGLAKFDGLVGQDLELAFHSGELSIYRVKAR